MHVLLFRGCSGCHMQDKEIGFYQVWAGCFCTHDQDGGIVHMTKTAILGSVWFITHTILLGMQYGLHVVFVVYVIILVTIVLQYQRRKVLMHVLILQNAIEGFIEEINMISGFLNRCWKSIFSLIVNLWSLQVQALDVP